MLTSINGFRGEYRWLSNFWLCNIEYLGLTFPSTENAYQACKFNPNLTSFETAIGYFVNITPGQAKRAAKTIIIRPDWDKVKVRIMGELQRIKYKNPELRELLLSTGNCYIEETNNWNDRFWGVCNGIGQNILGKCIMQVRHEIRVELLK